MRRTVIRGIGMTAFGRFPDRSIKAMAREAIENALDDAGMARDDIQAVFFANAAAGVTTGQECIRGETVTHAMGFGALPVSNVENACASAGTALHLAWSSVAGGQYDTVLAVGAEKLWFEDKTKSFSAFIGGMDLDYAVLEDGAGTVRSPFVDRYAKVGRTLIDRGMTRRGLAAVAAKAHHNGSLNPLAQRQKARSTDEVLNARLVVDPLTVLMCSPVGDGAAAAIVSAGDRTPGRRDITILASQLRSLPAEPSGSSDSHSYSAQAAFEQAGIGPQDLDFAEVHDATSPGEVMSWVEAGLCPAGDEERWALDGVTHLDGPLPVNPSGGLVARGHPIGATGLAQVYEAVLQLRGEAGPRQLPEPRVAMSQCGGGLVRDTTAVSCAHILAAAQPNARPR